MIGHLPTAWRNLRGTGAAVYEMQGRFAS
jgi:hypothetical protein